VVLVSLVTILVGAILLILPRLRNALDAGTPQPSPTPTPVATATPAPTVTPTPTPDPRAVQFGEAIKRVQGLAMDGEYFGAFNLLDDLTREYPDQADRLKQETEKVAAKLGSETDDRLSAEQLARLGSLLESASDRGSVSAQMLLGKSYKAGDPSRAFTYFYLAASNGRNSEAMYELGQMYANNRGVDGGNYTKAVEWFRKSADMFYPPAIYALGECYYFGKGFGRPNYELAFNWLQLAANQGYVYGQVLLGDLYREGKLGNPNYVEAARLWTAASAQGSEDARTKLIVMTFNGELVDGKPVTGEANPTRKGRKAAFDQFKDDAAKGNPSSMFYYAMCLLGSAPDVVDPDERAGRKQMVIAAQHGDPQAQQWCAENRVKYAPPPR
jgi:TPR repeat protein